MEYALKLSNVCKEYDSSEFALDNVTFDLPTGTVMGFVGENGAGKTTTIGCILNTLKKDKGSIEIFGKEMNDNDIHIRENIGVVYDGDNFPNYLSAKQLSNIMAGIYKQWDITLFNKYLEIFSLNSNQKISKYSKGMTMKLAIAVALSHHPNLLILDEATSGLDPVMREEILDIFLEKKSEKYLWLKKTLYLCNRKRETRDVDNENHSILLSSHITSDLERIADYITFIHKGKIILTETKDNLIYNYAILRCSDKNFLSLDKEDIVAYRKRDYQIDVLVSDIEKARRKYPKIIIDHTTIDEIMLLLVKGENWWKDFWKTIL